MKELKAALILAILIVAGVTLGNILSEALNTKPNSKTIKYEYTTVLLCREYDLDLFTNNLYNDGWEYVGQLCNNGINCSYIQFRKEKSQHTSIVKW